MAGEQRPLEPGEFEVAMPGVFPATPNASIVIPEGWEPFLWIGAMLGARRSGGTGFVPNALVTVERWPGEVSDEDGAAVLRQRIEHAKGKETQAASDEHGFRMSAEQRDPQTGPMLVQYRQRVLRRGACTDVVTVIGTCELGQAETAGRQLAAIVDSLRVDIEA